LEAGTIILMGSPPGVGCLRDPKVLLKEGDEMALWFDHGIGSLIAEK